MPKTNYNQANDPAFAIFASGQFHPGLTKMEIFTMAAMQGLCAVADYDTENIETHKLIAKAAVIIAEETLQLLQK